MKDFSVLENSIGVTFRNKDLLQQALVHRSYLNEHPNFSLAHNERLEFLGDAVLELIVTEFLYAQYPSAPEGDLTNWRASLVNAKSLAELAEQLGLNAYLYLSRGESQEKNTKARQYILANAFEALIGSIYLDQGQTAAKKFIEEKLLVKLPYILEHKLYLDPKSKLQEAAQNFLGVTPSYRVIEEEGPDHEKRFRVGVYFGDELVDIGEGTSKQEAQVDAADRANKKKGW